MGEVTLTVKGGEYTVSIPAAVAAELGLDANARYELAKAMKGVWVLTEVEGKQAAAQVVSVQQAQVAESVQQAQAIAGAAQQKAAVPSVHPLDKRIFELLAKKKLSERVEGTFEKLLGKAEQQRLQQLLKEGSVVAFKLSTKYKKAVYKTREELESKGDRGKASAAKEHAPKESESAAAKEKPIEEYCLEKDGFLVCKNEDRARMLSDQHKKEIEAGEIKGLKDFSGLFYIIENSLYLKYREQAFAVIKAANQISLQGLAAKMKISALLARIVCEFLKDEGEIIEKRKDQFKAIV
ncbi:MAG: hypothetical protein NTW59_02895 [Candidatus Diapherotrites archaeon]|nr:hypothetical protein [Candidatus Diapherotrites archaeon]